MNIALVTKTKNHVNLTLYDNDLKVLTQENFLDLYTLNFFLQTIPKRYQEDKTLLIFNNLENLNVDGTGTVKSQNLQEIHNNNNNIKLILAKDENSYFIE